MAMPEFQKQIVNAIIAEMQIRSEKIGIAEGEPMPSTILSDVLSDAQTAVVSVYLSVGGDLSEFAESVVRACIKRPSPAPKPEAN